MLKFKLRLAVITLSAAVLGVGSLGYVFALDRPRLALVDYDHSETAGVDRIQLSDPRFALLFDRFDSAVSELGDLPIGDARWTPLQPTDGQIEIAFDDPLDDQLRETPYIGLVTPKACVGLANYLPDFLCSSHAFVEFIRQPPALLRSWGLDRPSGYVILGRTNLQTPAENWENATPTAKVDRLPQQARAYELHVPIQRKLSSEPAEVQEAARLTDFLYQNAIRSGPSPKTYADFLGLALGKKIRALQSGEHAVMCAGFRDLWLSVAASAPAMGPVRPIGAYNFYPAIGDLVTFSHALAEFWVQSEQRWVLIDPWFGFMLKRDGRLLGVQDLVGGETDSIEMVSIVHRIRRFSMNESASAGWEITEGPTSKIAPKVDEPVIASVYQPSYIQYFKAIEYGQPIGSYGTPVY